MATTLYGLTAAPSVSITASELSTALPVGTFNVAGDPNGSLSETNSGIGFEANALSLAQTARQDIYHGKVVSEKLAAQTFLAENWTLVTKVVEGNAAANAFFCGSIYIYRPSTSAVVGYIYDSGTALGTEYTTSSTAQTYTVAGASKTSVDEDVLVWEFWSTATQSMATAYTIGVGDSTTTRPSIATATHNILFYTAPTGAAPKLRVLPQAVKRGSLF